MTKTLTVSGRNIRDIPSLYAEINRVFMSGEEWELGESLDALNDMLGGGYGAIVGREPVRILWKDIAESRAALGFDATRNHLLSKLRRPDVYDAVAIARRIGELEAGIGQTYVDTVMAIIADHPNIQLVEA